jgi:hypothetical protein
MASTMLGGKIYVGSTNLDYWWIVGIDNYGNL